MKKSLGWVLVFGCLAALGGVRIWYSYFSLPGLTERLHSTSNDTRCAAARRLAKRGRQARSASLLMESMLDTSECHEFGHDALPEWVDAVGGPEAWLRVARNGGPRGRTQALGWLVWNLPRSPGREQELKQAFSSGLHEEEAGARASAVRGLGLLRDDARDAAPALQRLLDDRDPAVRKEVVESIDKVHSLEGLRAAISSPDEDVRDLAVQYLGTMPERFEPAVQQHRIDLRDPELPDVLREQIRLTPPDRRDYRGYGTEAVPILAGALKDKTERISSHAASALIFFRRQALPALAALEEAARNSPHLVTRRNSMSALVSIGPEGLPLVRKALNDPEPEIRDCAKQLLEMAREKP